MTEQVKREFQVVVTRMRGKLAAFIAPANHVLSKGQREARLSRAKRGENLRKHGIRSASGLGWLTFGEASTIRARVERVRRTG